MPEVGNSVDFEVSRKFSIEETFNQQDSLLFRGESALKKEYYDPNTCVIQLYHKRKEYLKKIKEVTYNKDCRVLIEFSPNGEYMLLFSKLLHQISVYKIKDKNIEEMIEDIAVEGKEYRKYVDNTKVALIAHTKIFFDLNTRYIACFTDYQVIVYDME